MALATISEDSVLDSDWSSFSSASSDTDTATSSFAGCTLYDTSEATSAAPQQRQEPDGGSCMLQWRKCGCRAGHGRRICVTNMPDFEETDLLEALRFWGISSRVTLTRGAAQGQVTMSVKHTSEALVAMSQLNGMQLFGHVISARLADN